MEHNLDISKFFNLENSSYAELERKYFNVTLLRMLEEGLHADVTINANGGSVKAHRSVLVSVSPVFEAMFLHSMKEQLTSVVDLPDISIKGLQLFVALVYILNDDTAPPLPLKKSINEHFDELVDASCKYQVRRLERSITSNLKFHLTPENCWDYFHRSASMTLLNRECWIYILKHYRGVIDSGRYPKNAKVIVRRLLHSTRITKR